MITARSSFDLKRVGSEYKNLLRRSRGITIFYTVLTFIFFTLQYILSLLEHFERVSYGSTVRWNLIGPGGLLNGLSVVFFCSAVIGVSIGAAVDVFSYMQNRRSTDVYHSLPLTRDELLVSHAAAGITQIWIPLIFNFVIVAGLSTMAPEGGPITTLIEMLCWLAMTFAIFSVTTFAAVQVGTLFDTALFSIGLNGVLPALYLVVMLMSQEFLYGFEMGDFMDLTYKLSPVSLIIGRQTFEIFGVTSSASNNTALTENSIWIAVWTVAAIAIFILSMFIYRRRPSEQAETVGNMGPLQMFMRSAGTFVGGIMLAIVFCEIFSLGISKATVLISTVICSVIVYFVGDVLLSRTVRSIPKALPVAGITALGVTAVTAAIIFGGFGYETRVPAPEKVMSVSLSYYDSRYNNERHYAYAYSNRDLILQDAAAIEAITAAHDLQVKSYKQAPESMSNGSGQLRVTYNLKNGSKLQRSYHGLYGDATAMLAKLETIPEFIKQTHGIFSVGAGMVEDVTVRNAVGDRTGKLTLDAQQKQQLISALKEDLLLQPQSEIENGTRALGFVEIEYKILRSVLEELEAQRYGYPVAAAAEAKAYPESLPDEERYRYYNTSVMITESFKNTLAFFERHYSAHELLMNDFAVVEEAYIAIENNHLSSGEAVWQSDNNELGYLTERVKDAYYDYELDRYIENQGVRDRFYTELNTAQLERISGDLTSIAVKEGTPYAVVVLMTDTGVDSQGVDYRRAGGYYMVPFEKLDASLKQTLIDSAKRYYGYDDDYLARKGFVVQ
ncbi:MAG: hypothetical protein II995_03490 [Oscillospiraceae bacterium]|nr:hypothetical protein [Oscillospiraceae bacterium]